jgi:hypothetical protein
MKKKILFLCTILVSAIAALLSGCSKENGNTEFPDVTASELPVSGNLRYHYTLLPSGTDTVVDWSFGPATLKVSFGDTLVIASAIVSTTGSFQLVLPASIPGHYFSSMSGLASHQGGTVIATPETIRFMRTLQFKVDYTQGGTAKSMLVNLYKLKADFSVDKSYHYNFYDSDGTFAGTGATGNIYNWSFTKGWGMVESLVITPGFAAYNSISVNTVAAGAVWVNN